MPELSRFYGIGVYIYFREHEASIDLRSGGLYAGRLPARSLGLVTEWAALHKKELENAWERARNHRMPAKIAPLP